MKIGLATRLQTVYCIRSTVEEYIVKLILSLGACAFLLSVAACGAPAGRPGDDDDSGGDDDQSLSTCPNNPLPEICDDGIDNDCDNRLDCSDSDCSGVGTCPVCGLGSHSEGEPLPLPDGEGSSYTSAMTFMGFGATQTLTDVNSLLGVCVNMEHSWLRDLQIELICPSGQTAVLQMFLGQTGSEVYMGQPTDQDDGIGEQPIPGVGGQYCWTPTATNPPMLDYVNQTGVHDLPEGDYQAAGGFQSLIGCTMNGPWTIKVTDLWAFDNGFIFSWDIKFDPGIVDDCGVPPIG
jgi:subtilisin-like proprotein convertase family protein